MAVASTTRHLAVLGAVVAVLALVRLDGVALELGEVGTCHDRTILTRMAQKRRHWRIHLHQSMQRKLGYTQAPTPIPRAEEGSGGRRGSGGTWRDASLLLSRATMSTAICIAMRTCNPRPAAVSAKHDTVWPRMALYGPASYPVGASVPHQQHEGVEAQGMYVLVQRPCGPEGVRSASKRDRCPRERQR